MKQHTSEFKEEIKTLGRQQDVQITYEDIVLTTEQINSVTFSYQGGLLKSVMKQLEIDSNEIIPLGTQITFKYGILVNNEYEYLDYGTFIVNDIEKQEDTGSYLISCYDKLLFSMKKYERLNIPYPTTVTNFLRELCNEIGLYLSNEPLYNGDKILTSDLYDGLDYTYRDVLDELAEVTGSVICINENDNVEIRQIRETFDTIDEEYFKDINVNFGEKYGPINSIVLSRSGESDNVYLQDEQSIRDNGLCEIKIIDNQIMNFNNRSEFLPDLLRALGGIEYCLNDYSSTGIMYYDLLDKYTVHIGDNYYSCVMLNDEQNITQGLEEQIYSERPETSETDYTKADKTDQRINRTYIIVDKQNQRIDSVINTVSEQNNKLSQITQTVDELSSKISDISDITTFGESVFAKVELSNVNESEPIMLHIRPTAENISYLYPSNNVYPNNVLYLKTRTVRFTNTRTNEIVDYILPDDLLFNNDAFDEFILNYDSQTCQVIKRCKYNADGTVTILDEEVVQDYDYPLIQLKDGEYKIELLGYTNAYLGVRLMASNIYTSQFATKVEVKSQLKQTAQDVTIEVNKTLEKYPTTTQMNSAISVSANQISSRVSTTYATKAANNNNLNIAKGYTDNQVTTAKSEIKQTTDEINLEVSKKIGSNQVVTSINQSAEQITLRGNRLVVQASNFTLNADGTMTCENATVRGKVESTSGNIGGWIINSEGLTNGTYFIKNNGYSSIYTYADMIILKNYLDGKINLDSSYLEHYDVNKDGEVNSGDLLELRRRIIG